MAKTIITSEDMKNMFSELWENNDEILYINTEETSLIKYLNLELYTFKLDKRENQPFYTENGYDYPYLDIWLGSFENTLNKSYGLVEISDVDLTASEDIDSGSVSANISMAIQEDKMALLDYYLSKMRINTLGKVDNFKNALGETIDCYINIGELSYDQEPSETSLGKTIIASLSFTISYISGATKYQDEKIKLSFDNENYFDFIYSNGSQAITLSGTQNVAFNNPFLSGQVNASANCSWVFTYWNYKNMYIASKIDYILQKTISYADNEDRQLNIPIYLKHSIYNPDTQDYEDIIEKLNITQLKRDIINSDFVTYTMSLNTYAKE